MKKHLLVPHEIYSARVNEAHIPIVEKYFFKNKKRFPRKLLEDKDFRNYAIRMGHAYMKNKSDELMKIAGQESIENYVQLGDKGFDWIVPREYLEYDKSLCFICAGAGTNITFEFEIAKRIKNCHVHILDPSPQAIAHFSRLSKPKNISYHEIGLGKTSRYEWFYKPNTKGLGSLSSRGLALGDEKFRLEITSLIDFVEKYKINQIDYLKFDVEGCEHEVVKSLKLLISKPKYIAFELDQPTPIWICENTIKTACSLGYKPISIWGLNILMKLSR